MGTHPIFESDFDCLTEEICRKQKTVFWTPYFSGDRFQIFTMPITDTRKMLVELEDDRKNLLTSLSKLESQIYEFEGSYLRETGAYGNAVKGWTAKGFEKAESDLAANRKTETKPENKDRIFSNSSATFNNHANY